MCVAVCDVSGVDCVAQWDQRPTTVGCRSLTGKLSLSRARPTADG